MSEEARKKIVALHATIYEFGGFGHFWAPVEPMCGAVSPGRPLHGGQAVGDSRKGGAAGLTTEIS